MDLDVTLATNRPSGLEHSEALLDLLPIALLLVEPGTARVRFANQAAHRLAGGRLALAASPEEHAELYRCLDPDGRPVPADALPGVRVARGETFSGLALDWVAPDAIRSVRVSGTSALGPEGQALGVVTLEDVTEVEAERRRSAVLAEASESLVGSVDVGERLAALGRLLVPRLADWCVVDLRRPDGSLERALLEHRDPARRAVADRHRRAAPPHSEATLGAARVLATGRAELHRHIADDVLESVARDPAHLAELRTLGLRSALLVPLRVRGETIGVLALATAESGRRYDESDLPFVGQLADRLALLIENARLVAELSDARDDLEGILDNVADAVTVQRASDGELVYANDAAIRLLEYPDADAYRSAPIAEVRDRFEMTLEDGSPVPTDAFPGRRALRGESPEPMVLRVRRRPAGRPRYWRVKARPLLGEDGAPRLAVNVTEDITGLKEAELGQRYLADAGRTLAESLDYETTLVAVANLAVPDVADWCAVDLFVDGAIQHVATAHADPAKLVLAEELRRRYPPPPGAPTGVPQVLRTGRSELYAEITDEMLAAGARSPEYLELIRSVGMVSAMIVPMRLGDRVLGALTFVGAESGRRFGPADLALAEELGRRAASAMENARLYRTRSTIARTLQASLLPPVLPEIPGFELGAIYRAAGEGYDVGGDFYDVFSTDEDHWFLVIGDVCGKGPEAAAVTALARYTIRAAAARRRSPAAILRWVNETMLAREGTGQRFATVACAHLDLSRSPARLTVACGGHPLPAVLRADGSTEEIGIPGTLVGLIDELAVSDASASLHPGDSLVFFTDGLTEAGAPTHLWEWKDLSDALGGATGWPAQAIAEHLLLEATPSSDGALRDDVAILTLRAAEG